MLIGITIVAVIVVAVLAIAASKPDHFCVERSREIAASPERIFALIQDFREWTRWSPYEKKDPNLKRAYSGPNSGVGAVYAWDGNKDVGSGRMEILEAKPAKTDIKLEFFRPFKATSTAEFTLTPSAHGTRVTWAMFGQAKFLCKVISVFVNTDKMCGRDFEAGLATMQAVVEGGVPAADDAMR